MMLSNAVSCNLRVLSLHYLRLLGSRSPQSTFDRPWMTNNPPSEPTHPPWHLFPFFSELQSYAAKGASKESYLWWDVNVLRDVVCDLNSDENYHDDARNLFGSIKYFTPFIDWVNNQKRQLTEYIAKLPGTGSAAAVDGKSLPSTASDLMRLRADAFKGNRAVHKHGAREVGNPGNSKGSPGGRIGSASGGAASGGGPSGAAAAGKRKARSEDAASSGDADGGGHKKRRQGNGKGKAKAKAAEKPIEVDDTDKSNDDDDDRHEDFGHDNDDDDDSVEGSQPPAGDSGGAGSDASEDEYEQRGTSPGILRAGMAIPTATASPKATTGGAYGSPEDGPRSRGRKTKREANFSSTDLASTLDKNRKENRKFQSAITGALDRIGGLSGAGRAGAASDPVAISAQNLAAATALSQAVKDGQFEVPPEEMKAAFMKGFVQ